MEPKVHELDDVVVVAGDEIVARDGGYVIFKSEDDEVCLYGNLDGRFDQHDYYSDGDE